MNRLENAFSLFAAPQGSNDELQRRMLEQAARAKALALRDGSAGEVEGNIPPPPPPVRGIDTGGFSGTIELNRLESPFSPPAATQSFNMLERGAANPPPAQPGAFAPPQAPLNRLEQIPREQMPGGTMLGKQPMPPELAGFNVGLGPDGPTVSGAGMPAPTANAAMMGAAPAYPPLGQPAGSDRLEMLQDLMLGWASGSSVQDSLAKGAAMMVQRREKQKEERATNKTVEYLTRQGMDPEVAQFVAQDKAALTSILGSWIKGQQPDYAVQSVYDDAGRETKVLMNMKDGSFKPIGGPKMGDGAGGGAEYGLNPQFGVDAQGNPVLLQLGKGGQAVQTQLPDGVRLSKEPIRLDAGTHFVLLDPITRQPVGTVAKDLAGAASQTATGKAQGEAAGALPGVESNAATIKGMINDVLNDPNRPTGTGWSAIGNAIPGSPGFDFQQKVEQLKGQSFLMAADAMRGLGPMSEQEGKAATAAIARLETAQSEEAFRQALVDLDKIVSGSVTRQRAKAGQSSAPGSTSGPGWTDLGGGVRIREVP